jgi:hypothetical protein
VAFIGDENAGFKQTQSFRDRLLVFAKLMRERAEALPNGAEKAVTLSKAEQAEATARVEAWVNSPELQPPKQP